MAIADDLELEDLKHQMYLLARHLEEIDADIDSDAVSGILRCLLVGHTAQSIIDDYALEDEDGI